LVASDACLPPWQRVWLPRLERGSEGGDAASGAAVPPQLRRGPPRSAPPPCGRPPGPWFPHQGPPLQRPPSPRGCWPFRGHARRAGPCRRRERREREERQVRTRTRGS
jgi:hypothetical protein